MDLLTKLGMRMSDPKDTTQADYDTIQKSVPQVIQFKSSQMTLLVGILTIVFLFINYVTNYVEKRMDVSPSSDINSIVQVLNQQTAILSRLEVLVSADNVILSSRTPAIGDIQTKVAANAQVLTNMTNLLSEQARVMREQTVALQKLSIWLDIQIQQAKK